MAKTFNSIFSALGAVYGFPVNNSKTNKNVSSGDILMTKMNYIQAMGKMIYLIILYKMEIIIFETGSER